MMEPLDGATSIAVLLFLSTGLLDFALGSFSAERDKVVSDFDLHLLRGRFEQTRAQTSTHDDLPSGAVVPTISTRLPDRDLVQADVPVDNVSLMSKKVSVFTSNSRKLKGAACDAGETSLYVSSTVFPEMEGCHLLNPSEVPPLYGILDAIIGVVSPSNTQDPPQWHASYRPSPTADIKTACWSIESSDDVYPQDATWLCNAEDGFGYTLIDGELSVSCGCPDTAPGCDDGDSFSVESDGLPDAEGCYVDTSSDFNDNPVYTISGTSDFGQISMVALDLTGEDTPPANATNWSLAYMASTDSSEDNTLYCYSEVDAALCQPSEVPEWICEEGISITVECRCSSSSSAGALSPAASPTAQPAATDGDAEFNLNTCPGDGSFTITANANPALDGCFGASATGDGSLVYTVSHTTTLSEITIFSLDDAAGDFKWLIGLVSVSEGSQASQLYCSSAESARDVNPGNASWICDFSGESTNVLAATEEDISIVCGSCITVVPTSAPAMSPTPGPSPTTSRAASSTAPIGGFPSLFESCGGDGSFAITSNSTPSIDGCFRDTVVSTEEQSVLYTVSGTEDGPGLVVSSLDRGNRDFKWIVMDVSLGEDGSKNTLLYCLSVEAASDVSPGNATWLCDLSGAGFFFRPADVRNISIACGPCTTAIVPVTATPDASPASTLRVGFVAAVGAILAGVASAFAGWD